MLTDLDRKAISELAARYRVDRVLLFGSAAKSGAHSRDIDLAVEGLAPELFFYFFSDLAFATSKSVDLVDLSVDTPFNRLVRAEGIELYVKAA